MPLPLVLLSGTLCDARQWQPVASALTPRQIQIGDLTLDDSIQAMARRVLAAAPERFALAGFSMGAIVALEIERQASERVAALGLVCANARPDAQTNRTALVARARQGQLREIIAELSTLYFAETSKPSLATLVEAMAMDLGPEVFARQSAALATRIDSRPLLAAIQAPTLVVCAQTDRVVPFDRAQELVDGIQGARLVRLPGCGHMLPIERPWALAAAIETWLTPLR